MADCNPHRIIDPSILFGWCAAALKRCRRLMTVNQPSSEDEGKLTLHNYITLISNVPPPLKPCRPPTTFGAPNRPSSENKVTVPPQLKPCRPPTTFGALNRHSSEDEGEFTLNKSGTVPLKPCRPRTTVGALNRPSSENKMRTETVSLLSIGTLEKPAYYIAYFRVTTTESKKLQWYKFHLIDPPNQREPLPAFSVPFVTSRRSTIVASGSTIYSIGGLHDDRYERDDDLYLAPSSRVHCIDTRTHQYKECPPMHTPRDAPQVQVVNGTIYVMGGLDHDYLYDHKEHHPVLLAEVYHPSWNEWRELKVTNHGEKSLQLLFNPTRKPLFDCRMVADPTTSQIHMATDCSPCYLYDTSTGFLREVPNSKPLSDDFHIYGDQPYILSGTHLYSFDYSRNCLVVYDRDTSFDRGDMTNTLFLTDDSALHSKILRANYDCGKLFQAIRYGFGEDDKFKLWFETHELLPIEEIYKKKLETEKIIKPISSRCFDNDAMKDMIDVWDGLVLQEPYVGDASLVFLEQFNDVLLQENVLSDPSSPFFDLNDLCSIEHEKCIEVDVPRLQDRCHNNVVYLGKENDIPVLTTTCTRARFKGFINGMVGFEPPAKEYEEAMVRGLVQGNQLSKEEAIAYIHENVDKPLRKSKKV